MMEDYVDASTVLDKEESESLHSLVAKLTEQQEHYILCHLSATALSIAVSYTV